MGRVMIKLLGLVFLLSLSTVYAGDSDCENCGNTLSGTNSLGSLAQLSKGLGKTKLDVIEENCHFHYVKGTFKEVVPRLKKRGIGVFEFYNSKECKVHRSDDSSMKKYKPVHLFLLNPLNHTSNLIGMMNYFRKKLKRMDLLKRILNEKDENGRTMLDFLEEVRARHKDNPSVYNALEKPRLRMCQFGGVHSTPKSDCKKLRGI